MSDFISTILIAHYPNDRLASMERFDAQIVQHLRAAGGHHQTWSPPVCLGRLKRAPVGVGKWLGYVDKFILFPLIIQWRLAFQVKDPKQTLFILPDHSHGIYAPIFKHLPHVVHVHDLIAIRAAKGDFYGQRLGFSGRCYQKLIAKGLKKAENFICISSASKADLLQYVSPVPRTCEVVFNELNYPYQPTIENQGIQDAKDPKIAAITPHFLIHVGNRLWYKNRQGVLMIYRHFVQSAPHNGLPIPDLVIVGEPATNEDIAFINTHGLTDRVTFLQAVTNDSLELLYSTAIGLLFPSHHEGFGWPIIEAFACGCPVLTTRRAPMTEVAGELADYLDPMPAEEDAQAFESWLTTATSIIGAWIHADSSTRSRASKQRVAHSQKFKVGSACQQYMRVYQAILNTTTPSDLQS